MAIIKSDDISNLVSLDFQVENLWEMYDELNPSLKFRIQTTSLLFPSIDTDTRKPIGDKYVSGIQPIEDVNITFLETTDFSTYKYLTKWWNEIFDSNRMVFLSGNHRKNFILGFQRDIAIPTALFASMGSRVYNRVFRAENMIIKKIDDYPLQYASGGALTWSAHFSVDRIVDVTSVGSVTSELTGIAASI